MSFRLCSGIRVESLEQGWVAFSPVSGETLLLNAESAAVLEFLADGPADSVQVSTALAADSQVEVSLVSEAIRHVWGPLTEAGLVEPTDASEHNSG